MTSNENTAESLIAGRVMGAPHVGDGELGLYEKAAGQGCLGVLPIQHQLVLGNRPFGVVTTSYLQPHDYGSLLVV